MSPVAESGCASSLRRSRLQLALNWEAPLLLTSPLSDEER